MNSFTFVDSSNEKYGISFGWKCTIALYPQKFENLSLALCSFSFTDRIHVEENEWWAKEFISAEAEAYINKLIKNKVFW